ncbi:MAG: hypothetical protein ACRD12_05210 [Acidimicrobiales bacterium]
MTRGWRYWQLSPRRRLRSVAQRHVEWRPGHPVNAVCLTGGHPAPAVNCSCGVSAARDLETLRQHGLCVLPGGLVVGEVDLWGRIVEEPYGYRAQHASPASLGLVAGTVDEDERGLVEDALAAYGVPLAIVDLEDAVAGTTAAMLSFQVMSSQASRTPAPEPQRVDGWVPEREETVSRPFGDG